MKESYLIYQYMQMYQNLIHLICLRGFICFFYLFNVLVLFWLFESKSFFVVLLGLILGLSDGVCLPSCFLRVFLVLIY